MSRALAVLAVALLASASATLPPFVYDFEISNVLLNAKMAPATSTSRPSGYPFQPLVGARSDAEQAADVAYMPEPNAQCFDSPWLKSRARTSCQLCTIFATTLYREMLSYLFKEDRVRFASSDKEAYVSELTDFQLNPALFTIAGTEAKLTPALRNIFNDIVNRAADKVKATYCAGEGLQVFGLRSRNTAGGAGLWAPDFCSQALDTLRATFFERDLVMTMLLGCHFDPHGQALGTHYRSPPMMCPHRVLCSCVSRCPDGGAPAGLGDGCSGDCVKCKAKVGEYAATELAGYFQKLEWSLANLDTRSEREDDALAVSHRLQAERKRLNAEKARLTAEFAQLQEQLRAKTGTTNVEVFTADEPPRDAEGMGTPRTYAFTAAASPRLNCEWKPEPTPDGYPGTTVAPAGRPPVKLSPSIDFAVVDALDTKKSPPSVVAKATLELGLECTLEYEVQTEVAMRIEKATKTPQLASWPTPHTTERHTLNRPTPAPTVVPTSVTDRPPCEALATAMRSAGAHTDRQARVVQLLQQQAPLMINGQDAAAWLFAKAQESRAAYTQYLTNLEHGVRMLNMDVFFLDNSVALNSGIVAALRAQLEGASAADEQLDMLEQQLRDRIAAATQQSYKHVQNLAAPTLAQQLGAMPATPMASVLAPTPLTGAGPSLISAALSSDSGLLAWGADSSGATTAGF